MIVTSTNVCHSSDEEDEQECTEPLVPMCALTQLHFNDLKQFIKNQQEASVMNFFQL